MATTLLTDLKIYNPQLQGGFREGIYQSIDLMNDLLNGIVNFQQVETGGEFDYEAYWKDIPGVIRRRDPSVNTAVASIKATQGEMVEVKINRGIGPVEITRDSLRKAGIGFGENAALFTLGETFANKVTQDQLNTVLTCLQAAFRNNAGLVTDGSGASTPTLTPDKLLDGMAKRGDAQDISAWAMHSKPFFDLMGDQLGTQTNNVGQIILYEATPGSFGKPIYVSDSPALTFVDGGTTKYTTLGLTANAANVTQSEDVDFETDTKLGLENLTDIIQGEYATTYGLRGFAWDVANGGANPTDAALGTGDNWDLVLGDIKGAGGVAIVTQ